MSVVEETWFKELEDPDTFYTKAMNRKLLDHITEHCSGLHEIYAVDIPHIMRSFYKEAEGIPQFINIMESAQAKSNRLNLLITDKYVHAMSLQALIALNEYKADTREWEKLPAQEQTWTEWKKKFHAAYAAKQRGEKSQYAVDQPFGVAVEASPME